MMVSVTDWDLEYSPSSRVDDVHVWLDAYARDSAAVRRDHLFHTIRYGPRPREVLDLFPGDGPLVIFVHGGNWQELSKDDSAFPAPPLLAAGCAYAALDYPLAPDVALDEIVACVRRAVRHLRAAGYVRIVLSGSSAGAHLAAMCLGEDVAGAVLLSGMYDLDAVRRSYVNDALRLDAAAALRNSPHLHLPARLPPVVVAVGDNETAEYHRHRAVLTDALRGRTEVTSFVAAGRHHFDLPYDLGVPGTQLGDAVRAEMGLG